jgi:ABC-type Zn2+ transport system substrate-binding protein/surface adhesin
METKQLKFTNREIIALRAYLARLSDDNISQDLKNVEDKLYMALHGYDYEYYNKYAKIKKVNDEN